MEKFKKELLANAGAATRKFFYKNVLSKSNSCDETLFNEINNVELQTYQKWHQKCLSDMRRVKLHTALPELYDKISTPEVTVKQALALVRRAYASKLYEAKRKQVGKMVSLIQALADRENKFYHMAQDALAAETSAKALAQLAEELSKMGARDSEDLLYTKQSVKHVNSLRAIGVEPSVHELYQALEPRFAYIEKLYDKQINVAILSRAEDGSISDEVKDIIFDFIKESVPTAGYFDIRLIEYIFYHDRISNRAFKLFCDMETLLKRQGIGIMISCRVQTIVKKQGLKDKLISELSESDLNLLKLEEIFKFR